jgi:hypothetical protein
MPTETQIATQSDAGVSGNTPESQESGLFSQEDSQIQKPDSISVGSGNDGASTAQEDTRPKASDFVRERKKFQRLESRLEGLEQTNAKLLDILQNIQSGETSAVSSDSQVSQAELDKRYWENPTGVLQNIINKILESKISTTLDSKLSTMNQLREQEEAVNLVMSNELVKKDPEGLERMMEIFKINGLDELSRKGSPIKAAKIALAIFASEKRNGSSNQTSNPLKAQMSANAGGGGSMNTERTFTKEQLANEAKKLQMQLAENSEIRHDPKFQEKMKLLSSLSQK